MRVLVVLSILISAAACKSATTPVPPRELKVEPSMAPVLARGDEEIPAAPVAARQEDEAPMQEAAVAEEEIPYIPSGVAGGDPWVLSFAPYMWILSLDGDGRIGGNEVDIDASFSDILDDLNWVLEGRISAYRGKWAFTGDFTYADLGTDVDTDGPSGDVDTTMGLYLLGAHYETYRGRMGEGSDTLVKAEVGAGLLRTIVDTELSFDGGAAPGVRIEEEWLDLVFGARGTFLLDEKNTIRTEAFVGGFELLGDSSDLVWGIDALYGRTVGKVGNKVLWAGYRYWAIDYDPGNSFAMDISIQGPVIGFSWRL